MAGHGRTTGDHRREVNPHAVVRLPRIPADLIRCRPGPIPVFRGAGRPARVAWDGPVRAPVIGPRRTPRPLDGSRIGAGHTRPQGRRAGGFRFSAHVRAGLRAGVGPTSWRAGSGCLRRGLLLPLRAGFWAREGTVRASSAGGWYGRGLLLCVRAGFRVCARARAGVASARGRCGRGLLPCARRVQGTLGAGRFWGRPDRGLPLFCRAEVRTCLGARSARASPRPPRR